MAKKGTDKELEKMADDFLKQFDKDKKKTYKSERQMKRKSLQEIPISNLSKKKAIEMENKFYGIVISDNDYE